MRRILFLLFVTGFLFSCSDYQKVLKNEDVKAKYEMAEKLYDEGDFKRANRLLAQIAPQYVGKPQGERVMFFLADSYYQIGDYNFAGYQFERFLKSYPKSDKASQAAFLGAKSYYELSPAYSLDQTDTDKALVKLQSFINTYPESEYLEEANAMARELTTKKERKEFEIAKQFTKLGKSYILEYNISAIAALDNFVSDNPGSVFREEAMYLKVVASTNLAMNSTVQKKKERLLAAKAAYQNLIKNYPDTRFAKEANKLAEDIESELAQVQKQENLSK
ncbi:outer membrane protein assembly factor BamD [Zeaxanthinibacter enoshimensis]|uniref:Outer membrane protein assembly factor BamD n=1 Tax=Zeaxanthinibacter enoshimensis TaxID=392009 RepID=A0A4R6TP98_9FLAO|nr:outer membrane protein assembly factor BamD [Zeaxanthinibacter enoshimensis]TDQ31629.1 outer membrane protein assembly factor BamD [Zeaxanthinibacter enoshimensis]